MSHAYEHSFSALRRQYCADPSNTGLAQRLSRSYERTGETIGGRTLAQWQALLSAPLVEPKAPLLRQLAHVPWFCLSQAPILVRIVSDSPYPEDRAWAVQFLTQFGSQAAARIPWLKKTERERGLEQFGSFKSLLRTLFAIEYDPQSLSHSFFESRQSRLLVAGLQTLRSLDFDWSGFEPGLVCLLESRCCDGLRRQVSNILSTLRITDEALARRLKACLWDRDVSVQLNICQVFLNSQTVRSLLGLGEVLRALRPGACDLLRTRVYSLLKACASGAEKEALRLWSEDHFGDYRSGLEPQASEALRALSQLLLN